MGFNTVVLVLNDHMSEIEKCPRTLAWAICHPPMSMDEMEMRTWWENVRAVASSYGEFSARLRSGLVVLPTFHMDDVHLLRAGRNQLIRVNNEGELK